MNRKVKRLVLGLLIWFIPLFVSFFMWDTQTNSPSIQIDLFKGVMVLCLGIGFSIAIYYWLKDKKNRNIQETIKTGIIWFIELCILDLIVLVGLFSTSFISYISIVLMYLIIPIIMFSIGLIFKK